MKKLLCVLFSTYTLIVLLVTTCFAEGNLSGPYEYEIKGNGTIVITGFDWSSQGSNDIYVPQMINGYTVTEIGEGAFSDPSANITHPVGTPVVVVLPDSITIINNRAFYCTRITSINISKNIKKIGSGAFAGCVNLTQFTVDPENNVYATIDDVIYDKTQRMLVSFPLGKEMETAMFNIPDGIKGIDDYAFYTGGMVLNELKVQLPESIEQIGDYAFYGFSNLSTGDLATNEYGMLSNTATYHLPEALEEIGEYAFANSRFSRGMSINSALKQIKGHAFENSYLGNITFSESSNLESIGEYAFSHSVITTGNNELILPSSIEELEEGAFEGIVPAYDSDAYELVDLRKTDIEELPKRCFADVYLGQLLLPNELEKIGDSAMAGALGLVEIPENTISIGEGAFNSGGGNISFAEDSELEIIGKNAFANYHFNGQHILSLPEGMKEIRENAFSGCKDLKTIVIPESVELIEKNICDRSIINLQVSEGSYADMWVFENGYTKQINDNSDISWLND